MYGTRAVLILGVALALGGCRQGTYVSQRVVNNDCFRGVPHSVYKPYKAHVTWMKLNEPENQVTTSHLCRLPETYAIDVNKARMGTTTASFKFQGDGSLGESKAVLDQQVDEFIKAVGEAANNLSGQTREPSASFAFTPSLKDGKPGDDWVVVDIDFQPLAL